MDVLQRAVPIPQHEVVMTVVFRGRSFSNASPWHPEEPLVHTMISYLVSEPIGRRGVIRWGFTTGVRLWTPPHSSSSDHSFDWRGRLVRPRALVLILPALLHVGAKSRRGGTWRSGHRSERDAHSADAVLRAVAQGTCGCLPLTEAEATVLTRQAVDSDLSKPASSSGGKPVSSLLAYQGGFRYRFLRPSTDEDHFSVIAARERNLINYVLGGGTSAALLQ